MSQSRISAESIAEQVFVAVTRGDFHVVTHADGQRAWLLNRYLPYDLYLKALKRFTPRGMR